MNRKNTLKILSLLFLLISLPVGVVLTKKAVTYFSNASGMPANLAIDMSNDYGVAPDAWRNLAQGGEEKGRMLLPVINEIKALNPEYIRIDHVFDFYTEQELDEVISDIVATGAKPFISLSYMPPNLSKSGEITDIPTNWSNWENLVQKTIEHVSGNSGLAIKDVYYEVWNEPDLFGGFKMYGSKNYLDLYLHTAIAASRATNTQPFKLGGPATTGYYENWMKGLLKFVTNNNLRLDFLSWHRYSKNIDDYQKDVNNARGLFKDFNLNGIEMIISEMGPNSENDPVYDETFGAIHEIASAIVLQNEVSKAFTFEIIDGPSDKKYWGRWGLFTNERSGPIETKPRANALLFLNNMIGGSKLLALGQGSWVRAMVKKMDNNITRILVVNYDPKGIHGELVPIKLINLKSRNFTFKRTDFLGGINNEKVTTTSAEWMIEQYFEPNSAAIFEIISN